MAKPMSWQWKLTLLFLGLFLFLLGYIFTDGCNETVVAYITDAYKSMPEEERADSSWAWRYLAWANFRASVLGDIKGANMIYRDFCGLEKTKWVADNYGILPPKKFTGKVSADGKKGWGPLHPLAPEAFYNYICLNEPWESGARTGQESRYYFIIFYTWHMKNSPDKKPHPLFNKYWDKISQKVINSRIGWSDVPNFDLKAPKAAPWKAEKEAF